MCGGGGEQREGESRGTEGAERGDGMRGAGKITHVGWGASRGDEAGDPDGVILSRLRRLPVIPAPGTHDSIRPARGKMRGGGDIREHILKGDCFVKLSKLIFLKKVGAIYVLKLHILPLGIGSNDFNTIRSNTNSTVH